MSATHEIEQSCRTLSELLGTHGLRLGLAESCSGGWIAKSCTDQAGSSEWFVGGLITYTNEVKQQLLGVDNMILAKYGAVSSQTALAMADGVLSVLPGADVALAVTGIAGPTGETADNPVGLVWIAYALKQRQPLAEKFQFDGDRQAVRRQIVVTAFSGLSRYLEKRLH